jgi:hypothetical protein
MNKTAKIEPNNNLQSFTMRVVKQRKFRFN